MKQLNRSDSGWIYVIQGQPGEFKIGFTRLDPFNRMSALQVGTTTRLKLVMFFQATTQEEHVVQDRFAHRHIQGEWYKLIERDLQWVHEKYGKQDRKISPHRWVPSVYYSPHLPIDMAPNQV